MKNLFSRIFAKKFKTRVDHFFGRFYTVDWCHYRFIPVWWNLITWCKPTDPDNVGGWRLNLLDCKSAQQLADSIKSKEDVIKYYQKYAELETKWIQEKNNIKNPQH